MAEYSQNNRYLKGVFSQIREEGLRDDLIHSLLVELSFSQMILVRYRGAPVYFERGAKRYMVLYSSFDEFEKNFFNDANSGTSFVWCLEALNAPVYFYMDSTGSIKKTDSLEEGDGIIFDVWGDEFVIEGELLEKVREFFRIDLCSLAEIEEIFKNSDNSRLNEILNTDLKDWDEIIREFSSSNLWVLFTLKAEHVGYSSLFNIFEDNPFAYSDYVILNTEKSRGNQFAAVVSFKCAADYALNFGLSGITLKTPDTEVFISRQLLVEKYELIKSTDNPRLKRSYQCLFDLWRGYCGFK